MTTRPKRITLLILASGLVVLFGAGCSTAQGFGRDIEKTGDKIEDAARR